jgi:flagellar basal-body rod protein FlgG
MSSKGIYTALSGALAQNLKLDTIANNIANVNTPAFKKDRQVFQEYLSSYEKAPDVIEVPRVPASVESFYDMQGGDRSYVDSAGTFTDFQQGSIRPTGNNLDVALEGRGFLEVLTPQGPRLTRAGSFTVDGQGRLATKEGYPVLRQGLGQDPAARAMNVTSRNLTISPTGEVFDNNESLGVLSLVDVDNLDALKKTGQSLYEIKESMQPQLLLAEDVRLIQGSVEDSNVNVVQEMTEMIATTRAFEATQKAIQAYDKMDEKLVNEVARLA